MTSEVAPAPSSAGRGRAKNGVQPVARGGSFGRARGRGAMMNGFSGAGPQSLRSSAFMGGLTREEVLQSAKESDRYPPIELPPHQFASNMEYEAFQYNKRLMRQLRTSPYYVRPEVTVQSSYDTYSSRKDRASKAAVPDFADESTKELLNPDFFPPALWDLIFNPKKERAKKKHKPRPRVNIDQAVAGAEKATINDPETFRPPSEDEQDNMTESEEEGGNDYEENYFDPGDDEEEAGADDGAEEGVID